MTDFEKFKGILRRRYGVKPEDVGVTSEQEYFLSYKGERPADVVARLAEKYELERIQ